MEFIGKQFDNINSKLQLHCDSIFRLEKTASSPKEIDFIASIATRHYEITFLANYCNDTFGISVLAAFFSNFVVTTADIHYVLTYTVAAFKKNQRHSNSINGYYFMIHIIWIIGHAIHFGCMIKPWTEIAKKAKKTATIIHDIWNKYATANDVDANVNHLQLISLQILNTEPKFTAYGFFPLDWTLLHAYKEQALLKMVTSVLTDKFRKISEIILNILCLLFGQKNVDSFIFPNSIIIVYNWIYIIGLFFLYAINCYTMKNKLGLEGYSFISRITFCCNIYLIPLLCCFINISIHKNRKKIFQYNLRMEKLTNDFQLTEIKVKLTSIKIPLVLLAQCCLSLLYFMWDLSQHANNFSIIFWLIAYVPGSTIFNYFLSEYIFLEKCRLQLTAINDTLEEFLFVDAAEPKCVNKRKTTLKQLEKITQPSECSLFDKLFDLYSEVCKYIEDNNNLWGYAFLFLIGINFATWLSTLYNIIMDVLFVVQEKPTMTRTVYALDLWASVYAIGVFCCLEICEDLAHIGKNTSIILHKLLNIYPELQDEGEMYSLNLLHEKLCLTAAGFFILQRPLLLEILSTQATYFIVLVQLENQLNK
ncbi:hypothetical protein RN001_000727 [Aquatica leii]|uniref:Gustatory receptor n=1 Tax=Aquatica leii TaxID=1421715 RepID=A0AAN7PKH4_9COLE|nr:hypothetical protein RN001_000727 [Aquatica leii]